jgi:hypothetical protein
VGKKEKEWQARVSSSTAEGLNMINIYGYLCKSGVNTGYRQEALTERRQQVAA